MTSEAVVSEIALEPQIPEHPAWNLLDVAAIAFSALIGIFLCAVIAIVVLTLSKHGSKINPAQIAGSLLFFLPVQLGSYLFASLVAITLVHWRAKLPYLQAVRWNPSAARLEYILLGFLMAITVLMAQRFIHMPKNLPIEKYFHDARSAWLLMGFGVIIAPFIEEMFFRGLLFPALGRVFSRRRDMAWLGSVLLVFAAAQGEFVHLRWHLLSHAALWMGAAGLVLLATSSRITQSARWDRGMPLLLAITITAAAFALVHQAQLAGAGAPLTILFIVGVILTSIRYKTNSVCASWMVHCSYNATLFAVMLVATNRFQNMPT